MNDCVDRLGEPACGIRCARVCFQIAFFIPWTIQKYWFFRTKNQTKQTNKKTENFCRNFQGNEKEILWGNLCFEDHQEVAVNTKFSKLSGDPQECCWAQRRHRELCERNKEAVRRPSEGLGSSQPPPSRGIRIVEQTQRDILVVLLHRSGLIRV